MNDQHMKHFIFLASLLILTCGISAQNVQTPGEPYPVYCTIMGYSFWGFGKVKVKLDLGATSKSKDFESLYDENGKKIKFNTMIDVVNYMAKRGWTLDHVTAYQDTGFSKSTVMHYIMKKMVKSDDEIRAGLITRDDD